jgi:LysM repeat protein
MKRVFYVLLILGLAFSLAACVRSKNPVQPMPTSEAGAPEEGVAPGEGEVMGELEKFVTQTAMAAGGGQTEPGTGTGAEASATPGADAGAAGEPKAPDAATATPEGQVAGGEAQPTTEATTTPAPTAEATPAQPQPPIVVVPTATPGIPATYTIQTGESVYCISRRFDLNPYEVIALNGLGSGSLVHTGQVLKIPQTGNPFPGERALTAHPAVYTVVADDNIYKVACFFGDVSPDAIAYANNLTSPYNLTVGQQLQIP